MKAKLYLSSLHQDLIDKVRTEKQFARLGDEQAWTLCCDGFCCILDFSKYQNPADLVSRKQEPMSWYIRREDFGGLLWNPSTNRVFELDQEAFDVLMTLQEGTGMGRVAKKHGIQDAEVHKLMAQISESVEPAKKAKATKRKSRSKK